MRLGVDIGGTKTAAAILHDDGSVAALHTAPSGRGPGEVRRRGGDAGQGRDRRGFGRRLRCCRHARGTGTRARGALPVRAGACMPGLVDPASGLVRHAVNLGVDSMDLRRGLSEALDMDVSIENDVKAAALGADALLRARDRHTGCTR